mmetsp:Transcript_102536/g.260459  ORF Transcript_102536/g.260459 Transcript_102536/m.260459 type:complete len:246 (-) Transcript_102536:184-921(-)
MQQYVLRSEYDALDRRVLKTEQALRQVEAQVRILQVTLQNAGLGGNGAPPLLAPASFDGRDRSRSPHPLNHVMGYASLPMMAAMMPSMPMAMAAPGGISMSLQEFIVANSLDQKSSEVLMNQPLEVQQYVIAQGPVEGRNPSAMVMGRIARVAQGESSRSSLATPSAYASALGGSAAASSLIGGGNVAEKVEEFLAQNNLDEKCSEAMRNQSEACQVSVLNLGPVEGRNASAMVMGRMAKFARGR